MMRKLFSVVAVSALVPVAAMADTFPSKPVTIVVSVPAGGTIDAIARMVAKDMGESLGKQFVVENRPGANGNIAADYVRRAPADGYTLLMLASSTLALGPYVMQNVPFDPIKDFAPVAMTAGLNMALLVNPKVGVSDVKGLVEKMKANPGKLNYSSTGNGSFPHVAGALLNLETHTDATHVPYKGVSPAEGDLISGTVDMMFGSVSTAIPLVQSKKLKALAVTGRERMKAMPDLPTIEEAGLKGYDVEAVYFMAAPAKVPAPVLKKLADAVADINKQPDVQEFMDRIYARPLTGGPEEARAFLKSEVKKWQGVVDATGMKVD